MALQQVMAHLTKAEGTTLEQVESRPDILVEGFQAAFYHGIIIRLTALALALLYRERGDDSRYIEMLGPRRMSATVDTLSDR